MGRVGTRRQTARTMRFTGRPAALTCMVNRSSVPVMSNVRTLKIIMATFDSIVRAKYGDRHDLTELAEYFNTVEKGDFADHESAEVNLLPPAACVDLTEEFCEFHPLFEAEELFELLILDDANTSNHHCYAFSLPYPGAVIYFPHDGTTQIAFRSLGDYLDAARQAIATGQFLTEFHTKEVILCPDQASLNEVIRQGFEAGDEEPVWLLIQSSDLHDTDLMLQMVHDGNFYFAETIANRIVARPSANMLSIAKACAEHHVEQVKRPGKLALDAVLALQ